MSSSKWHERLLVTSFLGLCFGCEGGLTPVPEGAANASGADAQRTVAAQHTASISDGGASQGQALPPVTFDASAVLAPPDAGAADAARDAAITPTTEAGRPPSDAGSARDSATDAEAARDADLCPDGFARGDASLALTRVVPFTPSPEGVTVCPGGEVFVTVDGPDEIRRVPLDGSAPELYASLTGIQPAGIDCDERGRLFVAGFARRDGGANPPILMVSAKGASAVPLPMPPSLAVGGLNGIAVVSGVGVFASDTANGNVLRARELPDGGFETTIAAKDLLGANGLAYEARTRKLHMVVSFLPARVVAFDVAADGALSPAKEELNGSVLTFFDGVAIDGAGTLYVADYSGGAVLRGREQTVVAKLSDPASFAFRGGSLLMTSYHLGAPDREGGLYVLQLGVCGADRR